MKDLIVGATDKFGWDNIKNWIISIEKSGFVGDIVLLSYRMDDTTIRKCLQHPRVNLVACEYDSWGKPIAHIANGRDTQVHQMRFFHLWQYLKELKEDYRYVIITDTKDVVFQRNPSEWLDKYTSGIGQHIVAPPEALEYCNEPWGRENLTMGFGPYIYEDMHHEPIYNVGTIAVRGDIAANFAISLYKLGENKYIPNDQSGFNFLVKYVYGSISKICLAVHSSAWACQIGTVADPTKPQFKDMLLDTLPQLKEDGLYNVDGEKFTIVHQYDRNPEYMKFFTEMFNEEVSNG